MIGSSDLRLTKIALNNGSGQIPVLGFGTLIPTQLRRSCYQIRVGTGFRHFDCAERYRNEREVGGRCKQDLPPEGFRVKTPLWPPIVEQQSSARARRTGFRRETWQTQAQLSGSLSDSHSICVSTGDDQIAGSKRPCPLRPWRDFARYMEGDGESCGPWQMPGDWTVWHHLERTIAHVWIPRESSPPWSRSKHIRICRKQSFWNSAGRSIWCFGFRAFGHGMRPGRSKIQWLRRSPRKWARRRHRSLGMGGTRGTALLTTPKLRIGRGRISTSPPFRKTHLTKSIASKRDRGSMKWRRPAPQVSFHQ